MKVAIIGGGFTGLSAAYTLTKKGHAVTLLEASPVLGGLAYGFRQPDWQWHLEFAYHHWFTNDRAILKLIKELGLENKLIIKRPVTANLLPLSVIPGLTRDPSSMKTGFRLRGRNNNTIAQLDSPMNLLTFPGLSAIDKFRTAALLAFLKLNPFWKPLENITAEHLLTSIGGKNAYRALWEPLLVGKFSGYAGKVSAAWFWARIKKRTPSLLYMEGGFHTLVLALEQAIIKQGGKIRTHTKLEKIPKGFDKVLLTVPTPIAEKIAHCTLRIFPIPHLWAQTLILETKEPILDKIYWLNITDRSFPFLAAVAHTNFMDNKFYGGHHLTYFGNYLPAGHKFLSMTKEQLLKEFLPYIKKIAHSKLRIAHSFLFTAPFAQPVHELHYSQKIPPIATPIPGVYLANMDSIVPWDRGTNYAVELGIQAAEKMMHA